MEIRANNKLTVVVPIYNVASYLEQCIESILNQSLKEIEIILVNDASPDKNDDTICLKYAQIHKRIKYVKHERNKGLSEARNTGIRLASTKYIAFIDSDDWLHLEMLEKLYIEAEKKKACMVECNFRRVFNDNSFKDVTKHNKKFDDDRINNISVNAWNKLYLTKLFTENDIYYPSGMVSEDVATTIRLSVIAKKVVKIKDILYYHRIDREGSITGDFELIMKDLPEVFIIIKNFLLKHGLWTKYKFNYYKKIWSSFIYNIKRINNSNVIDSEMKIFIIQTYSSSILALLDLKTDSQKNKDLNGYLEKYKNNSVFFKRLKLFFVPKKYL